MEMKNRKDNAGGFSLVELLVGTVLFTIITGAVFSLLMSAQLRYRGESNVTEAFQQANIALDQITRDVHSPGYTNVPPLPCVVGGSCGAVPGEYDLIVETDLGDGNGVQWIRYSLQGTTLMRGKTSKVPGDPVSSTQSSLVPYLE